MPITMNPFDRVDDLTRAALDLIGSGDIRSMTVRKLAASSHASPSALIAHFENKQRLEMLIMHRVGNWLASSIDARVTEVGSEAVLPDEDMLLLVRAWLGLAELARSNDELGAVYEDAGEAVHYAIYDAFDLDAEDIVTGQTLDALVTGLWTRMCARSKPMPAAHAQVVLLHLCARISVQLRPAGSAVRW